MTIELTQYPDPWRLALFDGDSTYELTIALDVVAWLTFHSCAIQFSNYYGHPLNQRPTFLAFNIHSFITSVFAVYVSFVASETAFQIWQQWVLPFSISYVLADILWYCLPKGDVLIFMHHVTLIGCMFPLGVDSSLIPCSAGDGNLFLWMSAVTYLSETVNLTVNYRWWLMQTKEESNLPYAIMSIASVAIFLGRILLYPFVVYHYHWPRYGEFEEAGQLVTFWVPLFVSGVIGAMSALWLVKLCKNGASGLFSFRRVKKNTGAAYRFGEEFSVAKAD